MGASAETPADVRSPAQKSWARHGWNPCEPGAGGVQLRQKTQLTSHEYVTGRAWQEATLERCPLHEGDGCGLARHGTYRRAEPPGTEVARYYCRRGQTTFSLLPDCLSSRLSGSLDEVEQVVAAVEAAPSMEAAAAKLRPDVTLPGALRWVRRRVRAVRATVLAMITLVPGALGASPRITAVRETLATKRVLVALRDLGARHLAALGPPFGFGPRPTAGAAKRWRLQHKTGTDPPPTPR